MSTRPKNYWELTPDDFPPGEPVLKMKKGLWYRDSNSGYTDRVTEAGLYERGEALRYCFGEDGKNGRYDILAVPVRLALRGYTTGDLAKRARKINTLIKYAEESDEIQMVVF